MTRASGNVNSQHFSQDKNNNKQKTPPSISLTQFRNDKKHQITWQTKWCNYFKLIPILNVALSHRTKIIINSFNGKILTIPTGQDSMSKVLRIEQAREEKSLSYDSDVISSHLEYLLNNTLFPPRHWQMKDFFMIFFRTPRVLYSFKG